jgi:hypothetical protein
MSLSPKDEKPNALSVKKYHKKWWDTLERIQLTCPQT